MEKEREFNIEKARAAQADYCKETGLPHFAPPSGVCWCCGHNIYSPEEVNGHYRGIDVEKAGRNLVTGCPHCFRSYCD